MLARRLYKTLQDCGGVATMQQWKTGGAFGLQLRPYAGAVVTPAKQGVTAGRDVRGSQVS